MFSREEWTDFRTLDGTSRKAGVPLHRLRRVVVKELVDNALDAVGFDGAEVRVKRHDDGTIVVEDDGDGIPGSPEEIAALFSISRPLTSTKLLRLPTRGALGNGLRVVAGAVLSSGGRLEVWTRNQHLSLTPHDDGTTRVQCVPESWSRGTRVEVWLGSSIPDDPQALDWGRLAIDLANRGEPYRGKTSAHWYDDAAFFVLLQAARTVSVRRVVGEFDGCTGGKAGKVAAAFHNREANSLSRDEAAELLQRMRIEIRPTRAERLGAIGRSSDLGPGYARLVIDYAFRPSVPAVIEVWAETGEDGFTDTVAICVNRTPVTADVRTFRQKGDLAISGCGLHNLFKVGRAPVSVTINVTTPYVPLTSDGKAPDLKPLVEPITVTVEKATRSAKRSVFVVGGTMTVTHKDLVIANLDAAIDKASGGGRYRYSPRQVYYAIREIVRDASGIPLDWGNFQGILTDYEADLGSDLPGIARDPRGTLLHPHTGESLPLGTIYVEGYQQPEWVFNKVLYSEKEGFFETLRAEQWPERHDCALLTGKGFASRAARDVLDIMGDGDEELLFFCIHDADGPGTLIHEKLQEATKARPRRRVKIVNLGIEPWEGLDMGLQTEVVSRKDGGRVPVAAYVPPKWAEWLQTSRIELNAMTTPQFLTWLDTKMADHGQGKLVPPINVLADKLAEDAEDGLRKEITKRILRENGVDDQVADAMSRLQPRIDDVAATLPSVVSIAFEADTTRPWSDAISDVAAELVSAVDQNNQVEEEDPENE